MISLDSFIAEIKSDLYSYNKAGLISDIDIYKYVMRGLKKFGGTIMTLQDHVVEVSNGHGVLPSNFYSLYIAYKCDRKGYYVKEPKYVDTLQQSYMWVERVEKKNIWNSCDPCCKEESEKTIVEKMYFRDVEAEFHYHNPTILKLGKRTDFNSCHKDCRNRLVKDAPHEININGTTMYTNFNEGVVYLQYYGLPIDEEGRPYIPATAKGELETYLEYFVKRYLIEKLILNNDDINLRTMFQYYVQQENIQLGLALTEIKMLTPNSYRRLKNLNRSTMLKYECMFPIM